MVQGDPAFDDYLYIGGHMARRDDEAHLAIFRYDYTTSETLLNQIVYHVTGEKCNRYETLDTEAQYISHLGYMYDANIARGLLFGVT